jgi:Calx-beta domain
LSNPTPPATNGDQTIATLTILNSDAAVSFLHSAYSQDKSAPSGVANIDLFRQGGINETNSVDFYTTTNGNAVPYADYIPTNFTVTFNPGQTDVTVQVAIINNTNTIGDRTVGLLLTNAANAFLYAPSNAILTITDNRSLPGQISFAATNYNANEGDGYAYLTVLRTNNTSVGASVSYYLVPGTAQPNVNYTPPAGGIGTLTFSGNQTNGTIQIPLVDNNLVQGTVGLTVWLTNATGGATLIAPTNANLSIADNDTGFAFLSATNYFRETNGVISVLVQRIGLTNGTVQVSYATTNGTAQAGVNYMATNGVLTFSGGQTLQSIFVTLKHDPRVTGDLNFIMNLSNPINVSNPGAGAQLGSLSNTVVVVQDADAGLSFSNATLTVPKNVIGGVAHIPVICSNPGIEPPVATNITPLSVHYATADGTATNGQDYQAVSGTLIFTNDVGTNYIDVPIINNSFVTGTRSFTVSLFGPTAPGQVVPPGTDTVYIVDNNSGLSFSSPSYTVNVTNGVAVITVLRTDNLNTNSTVNFATADGTALAGTNYVATNGVLTFSNGQASATFAVTLIGNTTVQPDKTVLLQLSSPSNAFLIAPYAATLTIQNTSGSLVVPAGSVFAPGGDPNDNGIIDPGEHVSMLFGFRASGGNNVTNLVATLLATNGVTAPSGSQTYQGTLVVNGPSASLPFSFTANGTNSQQIAATFHLQDAATNNLGSAIFTYTLGAWTMSFTNPAPIIINDDTIASPYPSDIIVSNVGGMLIKATVTVTNLNHTWPSDIDMLLVSPAAQDTLLMGHAGASYTIRNVTLTFDDAATNSLPLTNMITSGTNKPTAYLPVPNFP